jgi:hypothetical protein
MAEHEHDHVELRPEQATIPAGHSWNRIPLIGGVVALLGAVLCVILGPGNSKQFFFSWLVSFLFFMSIALGALFFVLIQYAAQGGWGVVLRRIGETVFSTIPLMAILFLPVVLGMHDLYEWSHADAVEHDALLRWKEPYLNSSFFLIRAALFFAIWSFIAINYYNGSRRQDSTGDHAISVRLRKFAGPSIIVLALTQSFAAIDWIMSLTPHWYSTMFGVYFFAGSWVGFIALLSVLVSAMRGAGLVDKIISREHMQDVGKFLFAFTAFWAYIAFSQFFLMWYGNMPEETIFFKARMEGSWLTVSLILLFGHFFAPFFYLMGRSVKRNGATLALGGLWVLLMHFVDLYWQVMPTLHPEGFSPSLLDVAAFMAVGGSFVATAGWLMRRQALVPLRDPRLAESLAFENV